MKDDLRWRLRWAAAYLADRYYLNEHGETYSVDGYAVVETYKSFSIDVALSFVALSRALDTESIKEICQVLLFTTLGFIDEEMMQNKRPEDVNITVPWMLYEHCAQFNQSDANETLMARFSRVTFPFIFCDHETFAEGLGSYELGRGIVETLRQLVPVAERLGRIFDVDMS